MKKLAAVFCAFAILGVQALALAGETKAPEKKSGSWKGEILDLACFIDHGKKGASHASCAKTCVKGGQPMGLLTDDGKVLLLAADHSNEKPFNDAKELAGKKAEITGSISESSGLTMLTVSGVAAAKQP